MSVSSHIREIILKFCRRDFFHMLTETVDRSGFLRCYVAVIVEGQLLDYYCYVRTNGKGEASVEPLRVLLLQKEKSIVLFSKRMQQSDKTQMVLAY